MIDSQFFRFVVKAFQEFQSWIFNESFNSYLEVFFGGIGFMRNYEINEMEREIIGRVEKERLFLAFLSSHYP